MKRRRSDLLVLLGLTALVAACGDNPVLAPSLTESGITAAVVSHDPAACLANPDHVVTDETELRAAVDVSGPGARIAVQGIIEVQGMVVIRSPGITLGCSSPGSGLKLAPESVASMLIWVAAPDVTIRGLVIDGSATSLSAVYSQNAVASLGPPVRLRLEGNRVTCGNAMCAFLVATTAAVVSDNHFEGNGNPGGLQIQAQTLNLPDGSTVTFRPDAVRVERNVIVQRGTPGPAGVLSGIRVTGGDDVVVADNVIQGAWVRGMGLTGMARATIAGNRIEGVQEEGILTSINPGDLDFRAGTIRNNRITGGGGDGIRLDMACGNRVESNVIQVGGDAVALSRTSGGNVVRHAASAVRDRGYWDCDGDRLADFNLVNGRTTLDANRAEISRNDATHCLTAPDFVVRDEAELMSAVEAAAPWDEIGVEGTITLQGVLRVWTPALTIGCASSDAGLIMVPGSEGEFWSLLDVRGPDVTLRGLKLDGAGTHQLAVYAADGGATPFANVRFRFVGNNVALGPQGGLFTSGAVGPTVTDNRFHGLKASFGIHVQFQGSDSRVERNQLLVSEPGFLLNAVAAGIRFRDSEGGRVADNVIRGPWVRGINVAEVRDSEITGNVVEGVVTYGLRSGVNWYLPVSVHGNRIQNNRISGAGEGGMLFQQACSNVLLGNRLGGNGGGVGVFFDVTTGLNVLTGNTDSAVDNGDFDCNGDGVSDPNIITGRGKVLKGLAPGDVISGVAQGGPRALR